MGGVLNGDRLGDRDQPGLPPSCPQQWAGGNPIPACNAVSGFVGLVATQTGKTVDPVDAERWLADAARAATLMGC